MSKPSRSRTLRSLFRRRGLRRTGAASKRGLPSAARFHIERLEDRFLMNGDNAVVAAAVATPPSTSLITSFPIASPSSLQVASPLLVADDVSYWAPPVASRSPFADFDRIDEIPDWIVEEVDAKYGEMFGKVFEYSYPIYSYFADDSNGPVILNSSAIGDSGSFSGTNVQEAGVDEADLVETDGEYLYVISGNELVIVDARDTSDLKITARVRLAGRTTGMYLSGDRLTLVSEDGGSYRRMNGSFLNFSQSYRYPLQDSTTTVTVLDVSDRAAPNQVQQTELNGRLVSSRMVDGELRLVVRQSFPNYLPQLNRVYEGVDEETGRSQSRYETRNEYLGRVHQTLSNYSLPSYRTRSVGGEVIQEESLMNLEEVLRPGTFGRPSAMTIATFDVQSDTAGPTATKTVMTINAAEIYATEESLYVFGQAIGNGYYGTTTVWKFEFGGDDHAIELAAQGEFQGILLNQYSADESDGYLRIVTRDSGWRGSQNLLVLDQVGEKLEVVGKVENLAPGERLHSVRFMGDRAFVVTFKKVDPLFAIDLSDPTAPELTGELVIPGYSDYLQPINENYLLGIGRGADVSGGLFREMQVSIFNVSDLSDPQLAYRYSFGGGRSTASIATGGRWSRGDGDPHAVSYFPSEQILAIPIYSADQGGGFWGGVDNTPLFERGEGGLQVFRIDVETGFQPTALIEHESPIVRSLRLGDQLIAISADAISAHNLNDPTQQIGQVNLLIGSDIGLVELVAHQPYSKMQLQSLATAVTKQLAHGRTREIVELAMPEELPSSRLALAVEDVSTVEALSDRDDTVSPRDHAFADETNEGKQRFGSDLAELLAAEFATISV